MRYQQDDRPRRPHRECRTLLTVKDLDAILRIDAETIHSYVQPELIPYVRIESNV